jgi:hypothetical protein
VQNRQPLVVDREGGAFYRRGLESLLRLSPARRPKLVHIETWNELHEGTDVCDTVEFGRQYIGLTRWFADLFHDGAQLGSRGPYSGRRCVACDLGRGESWGLVHRSGAADGLTAPGQRDGVPCRVAKASQYGPGHYFYFDVDDSFAYDAGVGDFVVRVIYYDGGTGGIGLEYDSADPSGSVREGAFKSAGSVALRGTRRWVSHEFRLSDARFANRTNRADFRLTVGGEDVAIRGVRVSRP